MRRSIVEPTAPERTAAQHQSPLHFVGASRWRYQPTPIRKAGKLQPSAIQSSVSEQYRFGEPFKYLTYPAFISDGRDGHQASFDPDVLILVQ